MTDISLKLTWPGGGAEITCAAGDFDSVVAAAERLIGAAAPLAESVTSHRPAAPDDPADEQAGAVKAQPKIKVRRAPTPRTGAKPEKNNMGSGVYADFADFKWELTDDIEKKLVEFYAEKSPKTQEEKIAVILVGLKSFASRQTATYNEIYKAFKLCDKGVAIKSLRGVVSNMLNKNLATREDDGVRLKVFGEDLVEKELPRAEKQNAA